MEDASGISFPSILPAGAIWPDETGSNLWHDGGLLWGKVVNLCGLWVAHPNRLFKWSQFHEGLGKVLVAQFLMETKARFRRQDEILGEILDLGKNFRVDANELVYDAFDYSFSVSGGDLGGEIVDIFPSTVFEDDAELEKFFTRSGDWVIFGKGENIERWKSATQFVTQNDLLEGNFKRLAQLGAIEVSGRFPHAVSDRVVLEPDVFFSDIQLVPGHCKLIIGETLVWGATIRLSQSLAISGMIPTSTETNAFGAIGNRKISSVTMTNWLHSFVEQHGRKATRDEAITALSSQYTSSSIRVAYAAEPNPSLKRSIGEKR
jgi:hypothetical protein